MTNEELASRLNQAWCLTNNIQKFLRELVLDLKTNLPPDHIKRVDPRTEKFLDLFESTLQLTTTIREVAEQLDKEEEKRKSMQVAR